MMKHNLDRQLLENRQKSVLSVDDSGIIRMDKRWRQKLWIDFDRDNEIEIQQVEEEKDQDALMDVRELKIDNHTASEDYLTQLYEHIRQSKSKVQLRVLEIAKVLITGPKAQLISQILKLPNCEIEELVLDRCRARSEKMGILFTALTNNASVMNLSLKNMNIPRDSLAVMGDMFGGNRTLKMLTLYNTGLSDNAIQMLASGVEQSQGLVYLDLRQNTYESEGFQKLVNSLTGIDSLLTLRINAVQIEENEIKLLKQLFSHKACHIQNLEMEELEVSDSMSKDVIEAVCQLKRLFTFDFSNNQLPQQMTENIIIMIQKYEMLEILCIDHCEVTDSIARNIFHNMPNTKLQFLNISWNHISGKSIKDFVKVVELNQGLEKLAMQHNRFGEGDLTKFARVISKHKSLTYLDISANQIENHNFVQIYAAVQVPQSQISIFHCRKNKVGGSEIDEVLLHKSLHLSVLNLSSNKLNESNSRILFEYVQDNSFIESLCIDSNILVSAQIMNDIEEECRQNILIKRNILQVLPLAQDTGYKHQTIVDNCYHDFNVSVLELRNITLDYVDFVRKFAHQNQTELKKLELTDIHFTSRVQIQFQELFSPTDDSTFYHLKILHIQDCNLSKTSVKKILRSLKKMHSLEELHLVNLEPLEMLMGYLAESIKKHKFLKVLDLRQNSLRKREVSELVPLLQNNNVLEHLDISSCIISKKNMKLLWLALHVNCSVHNLKYSRINFFAIDEIFALDKELHLNQIIREEILPQVNKHHSSSTDMKELSLRGFKFPPSTNPAIIKFIKTRMQLKSLDLSATDLSSADIDQFIQALSKRQIQMTSLNLSDNSTVNDSVVTNLCYLFTNSSTIENLYLDNTKITIKGVKKLLDSIKESLKVRTISLRRCNLKLDGAHGRFIVQQLKENISLTDFEYTENGSFTREFIFDVNKELTLNKQIVEKILPQLVTQENEARVKTKEDKKTQRRSGKFFRTQKSTKSQVDPKMEKSSASNMIDTKHLRHQANPLKLISEDSQPKSKYSDPLSPRSVAKRRASRKSIQIKVGLGPSKGKGRGSPELNSPKQDDYIAADQHAHSDESADKKEEESESDSSGFSFSHSEFSGDDEDGNVASGKVQNVQKQGGFNLSMSGFNLKDGIGFITKFTRVFRQINKIDFGQNKLQEEDMHQFSEQLKLNKYIQEVVISKKGASKHQQHMIDAEIQKNVAINAINNQLGNNESYSKQNQLNLADQNFKDLRFLPKMIKDFENLQSLDLSNSDLRHKDSVIQLCQMIDENDTITNLVLRHCNINGNTLNRLADALTKTSNKNLTTLDIQDNPIQDPQLKVLFGLLQNNETLLQIHYTLYEQENITRLEKFRRMNETGNSWQNISQIFEHEAHEHAHHEIPIWQKICFPIWCWKSLIHDKHEAFRFKYDTEAMTRVEHEIMPSTKLHLYLWSIVYYALTFVVPYFFIVHECNRTYDFTLFYLYGAYLFLCGVWEIYIVLKIQKLLGDKKLLHFNKWHVVELFMGAIARTDTFLDICFIHICFNCFSVYIYWAVPTFCFAFINLMFPAIMLISLMTVKSGNSLYQPYMESTCFASFIRENMLLATVLDSFCINNAFYVRGYPLVFGKLMGFVSFFTQDFPQLTIHVLFKLVITSEDQYVLKKEKLLLVGMCVSATACLISTFNMIMCSQNEFDPIVLETELKKRNDRVEEEQQRALDEAEALEVGYSRAKTLQEKKLLKGQLATNHHNIKKGGSESELIKLSKSRSELAPSSGGLRKSVPEPIQQKKSFFSKLQDEFKNNKEDESQANKDLQAYMTYLKSNDPKQTAIQEEMVSEEIEDLQEVHDTSRQMLPNGSPQSHHKSHKRSDSKPDIGPGRAVHFSPSDMNIQEQDSHRTASQQMSGVGKQYYNDIEESEEAGIVMQGLPPKQNMPVDEQKEKSLIKKAKKQKTGQVIPQSASTSEQVYSGRAQLEQEVIMQESPAAANNLLPPLSPSQPRSMQQFMVQSSVEEDNQFDEFDSHRSKNKPMNAESKVPVFNPNQANFHKQKENVGSQSSDQDEEAKSFEF